MFAIVRPLVCALLLLGASVHSGSGSTVDRRGSCRHIPPSIDPCAVRMIPGDEIWLVSSRHIGSCQSIDLSRLECSCWSDLNWQTADWHKLVEKHQLKDGIRTVVYLHGNRTDLCWSKSRGLQVFDSVMGSEPNRAPVRFVVWSWPTDPQKRRGREYRENSARSVWEGNILAQFLGQLGNSSPIGLIGYSFGAQAVVSAVEQVGTGPGQNSAPNFQIVCVAAALQKPWSQVANPFAACQGCQTTPLQLSNSTDRALRAHRFLSHFSSGSYACMTVVDELSGNGGYPETIDVGNLVGRRHNIVLYVADPTVAGLVRTAVLADHEEAPALAEPVTN